MSVAEISHAIQSIDFLIMFRESTWIYPFILASHLACIALFGGLILLTNMRLLGFALTGVPVTDLVNGTRVWKRLGLVTMLGCGMLLAASKMDTYYANPYFQTKLWLLLLAGIHYVVFRRSVYNNTAALDKSAAMPAIARVAAWTSLAIWLGILSFGRLIAYYESPDRKPGGRLHPLASQTSGRESGDSQRIARESIVCEHERKHSMPPGADGDLVTVGFAKPGTRGVEEVA